MVKRVFNRTGFTLIELCAVTVILGAICLVAPVMLHHVSRFYQSESTKITLQREGRDVTDLLIRFLREAKASSVLIDQDTGQPPLSRITFTTAQGGVMQYIQEGPALLQTSRYGTTVDTTTLSGDLAVMTFAYPRSDDPTLISVGITLQGAQGQVLELNVRKIHLMNP